jgi:hypothetical protein
VATTAAGVDATSGGADTAVAGGESAVTAGGGADAEGPGSGLATAVSLGIAAGAAALRRSSHPPPAKTPTSITAATIPTMALPPRPGRLDRLLCPHEASVLCALVRRAGGSHRVAGFPEFGAGSDGRHAAGGGGALAGGAK